MSSQSPLLPDAMPLREALRGLRHVLRKGGETLKETMTVDTLPPPAARLAGAVLREVEPEDLLRFGLIPEFAGRLPIIARLNELSKEMMVRIMVEPQHSIYRQFRAILQNEGVELVIEPAVFGQIADLAFEFKVGARSLRGIFEEMITPVLYVVPDRADVKKVTIRSLFEEAVFS